jgi:hypothetical protein
MIQLRVMVTKNLRVIPEKKEKSNARKLSNRVEVVDKKISAFFGKLPNIEDGLTYQKKVRREWK